MFVHIVPFTLRKASPGTGAKNNTYLLINNSEHSRSLNESDDNGRDGRPPVNVPEDFIPRGQPEPQKSELEVPYFGELSEGRVRAKNVIKDVGFNPIRKAHDKAQSDWWGIFI